MIKEIFYKQESFLQARIFPPSRKFSTNKEAFHKRKFFQGNFHKQGSFPQMKIFPRSSKFSTNKEVYHKQSLSLIKEAFPWSKIKKAFQKPRI